MSYRYNKIVRVKIMQSGRTIANVEYYPYTKGDEHWTETEILENGTIVETTYIEAP